MYTERHHWIFPISEMIKWILVAVAWLAILVVLQVWLLPSWIWYDLPMCPWPSSAWGSGGA